MNDMLREPLWEVKRVGEFTLGISVLQPHTGEGFGFRLSPSSGLQILPSGFGAVMEHTQNA
jgi:hypothetical protein